METVVDNIAGYDYGANELATSPVTVKELDLLKQTITLDSDDQKYLRMAGDVLEPQTESIVNMWRGVISSMPHLAYYFKNDAGKTDEQYKTRVKERFKQWIMDLCYKPYDQDWLNYQHEIGLRHMSAKKNKTDNADAAPFIPMRYVIAFTAVINDSIKPFMAKNGHSLGVIEKMHKAWCKAVLLHVTLWTRAYCDHEW
ncbi:protogloblin ApPgb [Niastella yeongjuensis]|uniref:Protogloblin ApPgb n=1 Tax=Niastella yeongjuensis TaxID=354355 RepID=A0A1V9DYB0_9BACT|nr:protoglobin domain-containing protein [Niastella yeongjuensis]OQP38821.1 protogloblin ApPgb [Niastella yeongjuensis]SEO31259.1 Protoglobin [Niastella yeongjuensis]